jgi:N-acetylneuraminate synthase
MTVRLEPVNIGGTLVGQGLRPYVVAEMSGNHNHSLERAFEIVDAAAAAGAHALKLQTYTADSLTIDSDGPDFVIDDPKSLWKNRRLYELYQEACTPYEWHAPIFARCAERGLACFSTPFDADAVDFLQRLNAPAYKVASFENIDHALLRKVAATGKPVIMSTGMASIAELAESVAVLRDAGCTQLILLKCTSNYPAAPTDSNLATIPHLQALFGCHVGLSDHTMGVGAAVAATALGAAFVEKHFTLRRADGGVDSAFSLEPAEMAQLVVETERAWQAIGQVTYGPSQAEARSLKFRRSLYVVADIAAGEPFTTANVRSIRPGFGLPPKELTLVLGRKAARSLTRGTALRWEHLG